MKKKMWIGMKGSRWKEILLLWGGFSKLTVDLRCSVVVMFGSKIRSWEKERRRSTWDREKREGKGAPEQQRERKWETNGFLGISGLGSEGKVARSDLFSGARLFVGCGFLDRCQLSTGKGIPNLRFSWYSETLYTFS